MLVDMPGAEHRCSCAPPREPQRRPAPDWRSARRIEGSSRPSPPRQRRRRGQGRGRCRNQSATRGICTRSTSPLLTTVVGEQRCHLIRHAHSSVHVACPRSRAVACPRWTPLSSPSSPSTRRCTSAGRRCSPHPSRVRDLASRRSAATSRAVWAARRATARSWLRSRWVSTTPSGSMTRISTSRCTCSARGAATSGAWWTRSCHTSSITIARCGSCGSPSVWTTGRSA